MIAAWRVLAMGLAAHLCAFEMASGAEWRRVSDSASADPASSTVFFGVSQSTEDPEAPAADEEPGQAEEAPPAPVVASPDPPQGFEFALPVFLDNADYGEIDSIVAADGQRAFFNRDGVLEVMARLFPADALAYFRALPTQGGFVSTEQLSGADDLEATFDPASVGLVLKAPVETRRGQAIEFAGGGAPPDPRLRDKAADFSAVANYFLTQRLDWEGDNTSAAPNRQPLTAALDGAVRLFGRNGVTLFGVAAVSEGARGETATFRRGEAGAIYDDVDAGVRVTAGDITTPSFALQSGAPIAGISVAREFSLRPFDPNRPSGRSRVVIERPSSVEVLVNGRRVDRVQLSPGAYDFEDFPFDPGANVVELVITDRNGIERRVVINQFLAADLLDQGVSEFNYSFGVDRRVEDETIVYDTSRTIGSFFHRTGVTNNLTVGLHGQVDLQTKAYIVGAEAIAGTALGDFGLEVATNEVKRSGASFLAAELEFQTDFDEPFGGRPVFLDFNARYRGAEFLADGIGRTDVFDISPGPFDPLSPTGPLDGDVEITDLLGLGVADDAEFDFAARIGYSPTSDISLSIGGDVGFPRSGAAAISRSANARVSWRATDRISLTGDARYDRGFDRESEFSVGVSASYRFDNGSSLRSSYDTGSLAATTSYSNSGGDRVGEYGYAVGARRSPDDVELVGEVAYVGNRFEFDATHDVIATGDDLSQREQLTAVSVSGAVAFADGVVAFGRPVRDAYAILHKHPSLEGAEILVDPTEDGPLAILDDDGPVIIPDITSYTVSRTPFDAEELPIGYDLGVPEVSVVLPARAGAEQRVGSDATISALGTLVGADGAGLSFASGAVALEDDEEFEELAFFTNSTGRFALEGLKPGAYRIRLSVPAEASVEFEVGAGVEGILNLGELKVSTP